MKHSDESLKRYKQIICEIAKTFDSFCCENNLRYFGIGGTAIGALRHRGFIPWDDDIDFVMPRPDYERFLKISYKLMPKYELFTHRNTPKYHLTMAKMCDADTSYIYSFRQHVMLGAFIDIFPLDACPGNSHDERVKFFNNYIKLRHKGEAIANYFTIRDFFGCIYRREWRNAVNQLTSHWYHLNNKRNDIFKKCDEILMATDYDRADYVAYFSTFKNSNVISPKKWFDDYDYVTFEDIKIRLPKGIDQFLTKVFGDYMTPPPQNVIENDYHGYIYINLDKRVSWKEAKSEYKAMK